MSLSQSRRLVWAFSCCSFALPDFVSCLPQPLPPLPLHCCCSPSLHECNLMPMQFFACLLPPPLCFPSACLASHKLPSQVRGAHLAKSQNLCLMKMRCTVAVAVAVAASSAQSGAAAAQWHWHSLCGKRTAVEAHTTCECPDWERKQDSWN